MSAPRDTGGAPRAFPVDEVCDGLLDVIVLLESIEALLKKLLRQGKPSPLEEVGE